MRISSITFLGMVLALSMGCQKETGTPVEDAHYPLVVPAGFPYPEIPLDNELTVARVALGKRLFYDPLLSIDATVSCASCHVPALAFADDEAISPGVKGRRGFRNAPTLANVAYLSLINKDGGVPKLDLQPIVPIEDHNEMGLLIRDAAQRLNAHSEYPDAFLRAYGEEASPFTITRALASFMRILISGDSPYDQLEQYGVPLAENAQRGMALFFGERAQCSSCHSGFNFTNDGFFNNGLYEDYEDSGRMRATFLPEDEGKFRVPTLRNIALTAPYMHDGSLPTLESVVAHYNGGGSQHLNKDARIRPLGLNDEEQAALVAFLESLTDSTFIHNPAFLPE